MRTLSVFILGGVLIATPLASLAAPIAPQEEIKQRQAAFKQMGLDFEVLGKMAKEKIPYNKEESIRLVGSVETHAKKFPGLFSPASSKGDTKAKSDIWSDASKWNAATSSFQTELGKLGVAARNGGLPELKTHFQSTAQSCKACHDNFRER